MRSARLRQNALDINAFQSHDHKYMHYTTNSNSNVTYLYIPHTGVSMINIKQLLITSFYSVTTK